MSYLQMSLHTKKFVPICELDFCDKSQTKNQKGHLYESTSKEYNAPGDQQSVCGNCTRCNERTGNGDADAMDSNNTNAKPQAILFRELNESIIQLVMCVQLDRGNSRQRNQNAAHPQKPHCHLVGF